MKTILILLFLVSTAHAQECGMFMAVVRGTDNQTLLKGKKVNAYKYHCGRTARLKIPEQVGWTDKDGRVHFCLTYGWWLIGTDMPSNPKLSPELIKKLQYRPVGGG